MSRIVYVNGSYLPEAEATISVFDRGFLFADGVYEVVSVLDGRLVDNPAHLVRLRRSLNELSMPIRLGDDEILSIQRELIRRNGLQEGGIYLQVSRGHCDRDFSIPADIAETVVMFTQEKVVADNPKAESGITVITVDDIRWRRRDIKTVQLLAPSLAKQAALDAGADDAWMVEDGFVTEGTSNNAWILRDGELVTRQLSNDILHGVTRRAVMRLAGETGIPAVERPFTVAEAIAAQEAFITSASALVLPVVKIDGEAIGEGKPGPVARKLRAIYLREALASAI